MIDISKTPAAIIAVPLFKKQFAGWLTVRAEYSSFEQQFIEMLTELIHFDSSPEKDPKEIHRTATAVSYCMEQATAMRHFEAVAKQFLRSADEFSPALAEAIRDRHIAKEEADPDKRIKALLALYARLYESLSRVLLAPAVYAFGVTTAPGDRRFDSGADGRARLSALKAIEKLTPYPQDRFGIGMNSHLRNAYAHNRYSVLDGARLRLWDADPKTGNVNWGPEIWTSEQLEALCDKLWFNSLGVLLGNILYSVNNRRVIRTRGWRTTPRVTSGYRYQEIENTLKKVGDEWSFDISSVHIDAGTVRFTVQTRFKGIDQDEQVVYGNKGWALRYTIPVRYVETPICQQLIGLLQTIELVFDQLDRVDATVIGPEREAMGELALTVDYLRSLRGESHQTFDEARKGFLRDTLAEKTMHMRTSGEPIES